jgi:hypothetical protein
MLIVNKAAYLLTLRSTSNLVLLLAILPACSYLLAARFSYAANGKDLLLARISCLLSLLGAITIGFSMNPSVLSLGTLQFLHYFIISNVLNKYRPRCVLSWWWLQRACSEPSDFNR